MIMNNTASKHIKNTEQKYSKKFYLSRLISFINQRLSLKFTESSNAQ